MSQAPVFVIYFKFVIKDQPERHPSQSQDWTALDMDRTMPQAWKPIREKKMDGEQAGDWQLTTDI